MPASRRGVTRLLSDGTTLIEVSGVNASFSQILVDDVPPAVMPGSRRARCNKIANRALRGPSLGCSSRQATQAEAASAEQDTDSGDYLGRMFALPSGTEWREAKGGDGKIAQANVTQSLPSFPTPSPPARFDSPPL